MSPNGSPRLVEILTRLADDWLSNYQERIWEIKARPYENLETFDSDQYEKDDAALWAEITNTPFIWLVRSVRDQSGLGEIDLREAACKRFDNRRDLVIALNELDADGTTRCLISSLFAQWPEEASRLFGAQGLDSTAIDASTNLRPKRGRPKADAKTRRQEAQVAAEWERAKGAKVYKGDFARGEGYTIVEIDRLLDRVRRRKSTSE